MTPSGSHELRPSDGHLPSGVDPAALHLIAGESLPARFVRRWRDSPTARALRDVDGRWISAAELDERTRAAAELLRGTGAARGDRIVLAGSSSAAFVIAYVGALRAGLIVVPLNPSYTESEVAGIVADAQPVAVDALDLDASGPRSEEAVDVSGPEDPALLLYTSGTTGRPKGALLTHGNLLASAAAVELAWRWEPADRLLLTLPLFHMHGLGVGLNGSFAAGASVELRPRFDVADVVSRCRDGATVFFGVPAMYQRLSAAGACGALAPLRLLVCGSAPLPAALASAVAARAGQLPLERYGMTETVMLTSNPYDGPRVPGTVGFPLPGVSLRLSSDGGEIEVRGPNVLAGYYHRPDADAEAFTEDGWFRTGDLGEVDEHGHLVIVGRSKELIITGGYNVYPREVEEVLATFPGVREVAVLGRPSEAWGEEVTAVVVADGPVAVEELLAHAARSLAPYKVPKRIEFTGELPRNALGKVVRREL